MESLKKLKLAHVKEVVKLLLENQTPFKIVVINRGIEYTPQLPSDLQKLVEGEVVVFQLANYTLASGEVEGEVLRFEAGFGPQNFGAVVQLPLWRIATIFLEEMENPVFINPFSIEEPPIVKRKERLILK